MINKLMRKLGWVRLSELQAEKTKIVRDHEAFDKWSHDILREHERKYEELAERWAETREHLSDRRQLHALQKVMLDYHNAMPPRPIVLQSQSINTAGD